MAAGGGPPARPPMWRGRRMWDRWWCWRVQGFGLRPQFVYTVGPPTPPSGGSWCGGPSSAPHPTSDALLMNGPLFVRFGGGKSIYLVFTFFPHGVRKVLPCVEGPEVMEMACKHPPLPTPQETEFDMGECTHVQVPWQHLGDVIIG